MIVGRGAIASALRDRDDRLYFAAGVANSRETRETEYCREVRLLFDQPRDKRIVYFSSLCVFTHDTRYARHKRQMEAAIKCIFPAWTIVRLGNIEWATNPNQLIPTIRRLGKAFPIHAEDRYLVTMDEFQHWIGLIPDWNVEINVPGIRMRVIDIVARCREQGIRPRSVA